LVTNYRGISIQPTLAKLLDRLMSNQLRTACKHVIDSVQHGFRQGKSTSTNLLIYQNYKVEAFQNGYQVDSIYEDFSKTFDRVNHNIPTYSYEGKVAKITLQILVMTSSIEGLLFFFAIFNITRASHPQKV
jgi:hypothetical protein